MKDYGLMKKWLAGNLKKGEPKKKPEAQMKNCCHLGRSVRDKPKSALPCSSPPVMARRRTPPSPRRTKQGSGQWRPGARASSYGVRARNKEGIGSGVLGGQGC